MDIFFFFFYNHFIQHINEIMWMNNKFSYVTMGDINFFFFLHTTWHAHSWRKKRIKKNKKSTLREEGPVLDNFFYALLLVSSSLWLLLVYTAIVPRYDSVAILTALPPVEAISSSWSSSSNIAAVSSKVRPVQTKNHFFVSESSFGDHMNHETLPLVSTMKNRMKSNSITSHAQYTI